MIVALSDAENRLSEVVHAVQTGGEDAVIVVDGEPVARLVAVKPAPRRLVAEEVERMRELMDSLSKMERPSDEFDAVAWVSEGRR